MTEKTTALAVEYQAINNLARTVTLLDMAFERIYKEYDMTRVQCLALYYVTDQGEAGFSLSELSEKMMVSKANITTLADRMENKGLLQRISDSADRRSIRLVATASGKEKIKTILPDRLGFAQRVFQCLTKEEIRQGNEMLLKLQTGIRAALPESV